MRNFFVDYSGGGASTRQGTEFLNQCKQSGARLIPFQPSTTLSYVLEFGQNYIRFFSNGAPIVETAVTGGTNAAVNQVTITNSYAPGDWVFANGWGGMTNVNGNYFIVSAASGSVVTVTDLNGNPVVFTGTYTSGGQLQRVYTITSPYLASDLFQNQATGNPGLKFVQNVAQMIITHPSYKPQTLTLNGPTNWTLATISFGASVVAPVITSVTPSSLAAGSWNYQYVVTAVDSTGLESAPSNVGTLTSVALISVAASSITVAWGAVPGAMSYNLYKATPAFGANSTGILLGFIGNTVGTNFIESYPGIAPNFALTPPIVQGITTGGSVNSTTVTSQSTGYTTPPSVTFPTAPTGGITATGFASLTANVVSGYQHASASRDIATTAASPLGSIITFANGLTVTITSVTFVTISPGITTWTINSVSILNGGSITVGSTPSNPVLPVSCTASGFLGFNPFGGNFGVFFTWGLASITVQIAGSLYASGGSITIGTGAATAIFTVTPLSGGGSSNPGVVGFYQQRLFLGAPGNSPASFNFSQPGSYFNFNTTNPTQADNAISGTIVSEDLPDIRWAIGVPSGLLTGTGKGAYLINGGSGISTQVPITPLNVTAQAQAFNGANDLKPLKINFDLLYATNKGNYVRDLSYNLYAQIFTGTDISVLSNHLFFGFSLVDWCFAEEPFKTVWATRSDGQLLSLGYVKEQDLTGWAHHDTNGQFKSICSVIESVPSGIVDAVYMIVQRFVNNNLVSYVERMADRYFPYGYDDAWSVDCALQTQPALNQTSTLTFQGNASVVGNTVTLLDGTAPFTSTMATNNWIVRANGGIYKVTVFNSTQSLTAVVLRVPPVINPYTLVPYVAIGYTVWQPVMTVSGLTQLIGQSVIGVADGAAIGPFVVSASGSVALSASATKVTLGLMFTPQLQTLPLDLGEPTVQGKQKKITALTLRVADTLGLRVGKTFQTLVAMKDFTLGNIPTTSSGVAAVTGLVNGDGERSLINNGSRLGATVCSKTCPIQRLCSA